MSSNPSLFCVSVAQARGGLDEEMGGGGRKEVRSIGLPIKQCMVL